VRVIRMRGALLEVALEADAAAGARAETETPVEQPGAASS